MPCSNSIPGIEYCFHDELIPILPTPVLVSNWYLNLSTHMELLVL